MEKRTIYKPMMCPILEKDINPCRCYETRLGIRNAFRSIGIKSNGEAWRLCEEKCNKKPDFTVISERDIAINESGQIEDFEKTLPCLVCNTPNQVSDRGFHDICSVCRWVDVDEFDEYFDDAQNDMSFSEARKIWEINERGDSS